MLVVAHTHPIGQPWLVHLLAESKSTVDDAGRMVAAARARAVTRRVHPKSSEKPAVKLRSIQTDGNMFASMRLCLLSRD